MHVKIQGRKMHCKKIQVGRAQIELMSVRCRRGSPLNPDTLCEFVPFGHSFICLNVAHLPISLNWQTTCKLPGRKAC